MSKYRDELVQTIKLMGQELIDRAESMVHEDCDMITNFNINIDIPQPMDGHPELTWSTSALSKNFYNKEIGHSAGDAKMETHVETVTVEKKEPNYPVYIKHGAVHGMILVEFRSKQDAEACLEALNEISNTYGECFVADLYDLCAIPLPDKMVINYGWTSLKGVEVHALPNECAYVIELPKPMPLK